MRVLSVGEDPATVDYSKTPDGVDEAYIRKGVDDALAEMEARGWQARVCYLPPEIDEALETFRRMATAEPVDVLLIGGGLRMPPGRIGLFEAVMNEARHLVPDARLAFDNDPNEAADAVARQIS